MKLNPVHRRALRSPRPLASDPHRRGPAWSGVGLLVLVMNASSGSGCQTIPPKPSALEPAQTRAPIRVVALSDFHGALEPTLLTTAEGAKVERGGVALIGAYLERLRATAPGPVLFLDAGDMFQGTLVSSLKEGAPVIRVYNALGVAASAVGNHEFDFGPVGPASVVRIAGQRPRGALEARAKEAHFPMLAANLLNDEGQVAAPFKAHTIVTLGGYRIGLIGVSSAQTASTTVSANLRGLTVADPNAIALREARLLHDRTDLVVVILHGGSDCKPIIGEGAAGCETGELTRLSALLEEDNRAVEAKGPAGSAHARPLVDLIIGGHTHGLVARRLGPMGVMQGSARGTYLAWAEIGGSRRVAVVHNPVEICGQTVPSDAGKTCAPKQVRSSHAEPTQAEFLGTAIEAEASLTRLIAPEVEAVKAVAESKIGASTCAEFSRSYSQESALGNLVADAFRAAIPGAQLGLTNGGGLRASLPKGALRYGDVFAALPFDNHLVRMTRTGAELKAILRLSLGSGHGALSWSGLRYRADGCTLGPIWVGDTPLEMDRSYLLVTTDYLAGGGSGFDSLHFSKDSYEVLWDHPLIRDVVAAYLKGLGHPIDPILYFNPDKARQRHTARCEVERKAGN